MTWPDVHYKKLTVPAWVECRNCGGFDSRSGCLDCNMDGGKWHEAVEEMAQLSNLKQEKWPHVSGVPITRSTILYQLYDPCGECGGNGGSIENIYISSSWKNRDDVRIWANKLRSHVKEVYDFTDPRCRTTPEIPPEMFEEQFDPKHHMYSLYLNKDEWRDAVVENKKAIERSDLILLILPCGIDATADWAYGLGLGKKSIIVGHPHKGERSPVHLWADAMVETADQALEWIISQHGCPSCLQDSNGPTGAAEGSGQGWKIEEVEK